VETGQKHLINLLDVESDLGLSYIEIYDGSLAMLAQLHRHRTIKYNMVLLWKESNDFYVPPILDGEIASMWIDDIASLQDYTPQGTMVKIIERGTVENFLLKTMERACGRAQLEIARRTKETAESYLIHSTVTGADSSLQEFMAPYFTSRGELKPRCATGFYTCSDNCPFGTGNAFKRLV
jgi:hypothetical protein